jgi:hypothetical protein
VYRGSTRYSTYGVGLHLLSVMQIYDILNVWNIGILLNIIIIEMTYWMALLSLVVS